MSMGPGPAQAWMPRPYPQLLRGPNYAWWRPLWSVVLMLAAGVLLMLAMFAVYAGVALGSGADLGASESDLLAWESTAAGLLVANVALAGLIPVAQVAVWGGFGWRPRWVGSVTGGIRWAWLARAAAFAFAAMAAINLGFVAWDGGFTLDPEPNLAWFAVVVLFTTPLQAAGEEYFFRGWMSQALGSMFSHPVVGGVVAALVSATVFAALHGADQSAWVWLDRFAFGLTASWLVWRTGGLEASIAMHAVNNVIAFGLAALSGQVSEAMTVTEAPAASVIVDIVLFVLVAVVLDQLARRWAIQRMFRPPVLAW